MIPPTNIPTIKDEANIKNPSIISDYLQCHLQVCLLIGHLFPLSISFKE